MDFHFNKAMEAAKLEPGLPFRKKVPRLMAEGGPSLSQGESPYSCFALVGAGFNDLTGTLRIFL